MDQTLQGPIGGASVDWRGLCEELADKLAACWPSTFDAPDCLSRAREALAQPEPEVVGPTDEELLRMAAEAIDPYDTIGIGEYEAETECAVEVYGSELIAFARAALAAQPEPERYCQMIVDVQALAKRWNLPAPWLGKLVSEVLAEAAGIEGLKKPSTPPALPDFEARAVLARFSHQPAPPAEGEVAELVEWLRDRAESTSLAHAARRITRAADLLEQRHPAPVPVPERLPGPGDCDEKGSCWLWSADDVDGVGHWSYSHRDWAQEGDVTHWLPATALPLPQGEVEE